MASIKTYKNNLQKLSDNIYKTESFDISTLFLSDKDVVKNILKLSNTSMTKDEIDIMTDDDDEYDSKVSEEREALQAEIDNLETETDELSRQQKKVRLEEESSKLAERSSIRKEATEKGIYPINQDNPIYDKAKSLKKEIREAFFNLKKDLKLLKKNIANSIIETGTSLSGVAILIASPPFNIPLAINTVLMVIDSFLKIIDKLQNILPFLDPLKNISKIISKDNLSKAISPINTIISAILSILSPISKISEVINKLLDSIISILQNKDKKKKILRNVSRKLKKLNYFKGKNGSKVEEDDQSDVEDLLENYIITNPEGPNRLNEFIAVDFKSIISVDELINLKSDVDSSVTDAATIIDDFSETLYDVIFPNGSTVTNVDDNYVEDLKQTYDVIIKG